MTVLTDDGCRLWTEVIGAGGPLVLCHGGPGLWDMFGGLARELDDVRTVWRWDQRGRGARWTRWPPRCPTSPGIVASCVKYVWLPGMAGASATEHHAYHQVAEAEHRYRQRGLVLTHLVGWSSAAASPARGRPVAATHAARAAAGWPG